MNKAFQRPKHRKHHTRVPRKFKKKYRVLMNRYPFLELNQKIWYILGEINRPYRDFLIAEIIKEDNLLRSKLQNNELY